jgi:hypothetical protein
MAEGLEARVVPGGSLLELLFMVPFFDPSPGFSPDTSEPPGLLHRVEDNVETQEVRDLRQIIPPDTPRTGATASAGGSQAAQAADLSISTESLSASTLSAGGLGGDLGWLDELVASAAIKPAPVQPIGQPSPGGGGGGMSAPSAPDQAPAGGGSAAAPTPSTTDSSKAPRAPVGGGQAAAAGAAAAHAVAGKAASVAAAAGKGAPAAALPSTGGTAALVYPPMPPIANDDGFGTKHDTPLSVSAPGVLSNDTLPPGTSVSLVSNPYHSSSFTFNTNGSFSYTPQYHYVGTDSFVYRLTNGGYSDTALVSIGVWNNPPVAIGDSYGIKHDMQLTVSAPGVKTNDYDYDGDPTTASLVTSPSHAASFTFNSNGSFNYTPAYHFVGTDTFTYRLNDGLVNGNTATVTIGVWNNVPVAQNDSYSTKHDTQLVVSAPGVKSNDYDSDGDPTTATLVASPSHSSSFHFNANGSFDYTPSYHYVGTDSFTYNITDGIAPSTTATVSLNVMNQAPVFDQRVEGVYYNVDLDILATAPLFPLGAQLGQLHAVDYNGDTVTYTMDSNSYFSLNATTGVISVANPESLALALKYGAEIIVPVHATDGIAQDDDQFVAKIPTGVIPSRYIDLTTSAGGHFTPADGLTLNNILRGMRDRGETINTLIIKGHGLWNVVVTGPQDWDELTTNLGHVEIARQNMQATMQAVTGPGSTIKLRSCFGYWVAKDMEGLLGNGTHVYGSVFFTVNIPGTTWAPGIYPWW